MAKEGKSSGAKIALIIAAIVVVLGIGCCVGGYFLSKDFIDFTKHMAKGSMALEANFATAVADDAVWELAPQANQMVFVIGLKSVPEDAAEIERLQDAGWTLYAESFAEGGMPLRGVAVGKAIRRAKGGKSHQGKASRWEENFATAETLEERTGISPPPVPGFMEKMMDLQENAEGQAFEPIEDDPSENDPSEDDPSEDDNLEDDE